MTGADRDELEAEVAAGQFFTSPVIHPSVDAGAATVAIETSRGSASGYSNDFSLDVTVGGKVAAVTGSVTAGFHWAWSYQVSFEETVSVEGSVSELNGIEGDYGFGMMMYPTAEGVLVVDYWVE